MKAHDQSGNAHAFVIIILVIALISALGFIFWQNFSQEKDASIIKSDKTSRQSAESAKPITTTPKGLIITSWGIKIPTNSDLTYDQKNNPDSAKIYSPELTQAESDAACDENNGVLVYRTTSPDNVRSSERDVLKKVGSYYYGYSHATEALCVGKGDASGTDSGDSVVDSEYEALYSSIKSAWDSLSPTAKN